MKTNLTLKQAKVLDLVERGPVPPTLREIGEVMGIRSTNGVNDHLHALERKGRVVRGDMKSRHLTVLSPLTAEERVYFNLQALRRCESCGHVIDEDPSPTVATHPSAQDDEQKLAG